MPLFSLIVNILLGGLLALLLLFALNLLALVVIRQLTRPRHPAHDARETAHLPTVLVQLPLYNEGELVDHVLAAVAAQDWPRERLEVQLLDDSTEAESAARVDAAVNLWRARGLAVSLHRRANRTGFKAGALADGLRRSNAEFVAVFDADFQPPPDFLRRTLAVLLADPGCALAQARWGHLNRGDNLLTRVQARLLDSHFLVELEARWRSGMFLPFNGTAGVWRRRAIEDAGGWAGDTLTEDLDLSLRAWLRGWRAVYQADLVVPAILPPSPRAWLGQQYRWTKGFAQCLLKLGPTLWRSRRVGWWQKLFVTLQLAQSFVFLTGAAAILLATPLLSEMASPTAPLTILGIALSLIGPTATLSFLVAGDRVGGPRSLLEGCACVMLTSGLVVSNSRAAFEALTGQRSEFVRTPKSPPSPLGESRTVLRGWREFGAGSALALYLLLEEPAATPGFATVILGLLTMGLMQLLDGRQRAGARHRR